MLNSATMDAIKVGATIVGAILLVALISWLLWGCADGNGCEADGGEDTETDSDVYNCGNLDCSSIEDPAPECVYGLGGVEELWIYDVQCNTETMECNYIHTEVWVCDCYQPDDAQATCI